MSSISTTISSLAATNPVVGDAVAYASRQSQILSTLSSGASSSVSLQNLLTSANSQSIGNITVLPTASDSTSASPDTTSATDAATSSAPATTPDFSGNSALLVADNQSLQSSQLLSSLTSVGGTFSAVA